jgi:hypothetical protein
MNPNNFFYQVRIWQQSDWDPVSCDSVTLSCTIDVKNMLHLILISLIKNSILKIVQLGFRQGAFSPLNNDLSSVSLLFIILKVFYTECCYNDHYYNKCP